MPTQFPYQIQRYCHTTMWWASSTQRERNKGSAHRCVQSMEEESGALKFFRGYRRRACCAVRVLTPASFRCLVSPTCEPIEPAHPSEKKSNLRGKLALHIMHLYMRYRPVLHRASCENNKHTIVQCLCSRTHRTPQKRQLIPTPKPLEELRRSIRSTFTRGDITLVTEPRICLHVCFYCFAS